MRNLILTGLPATDAKSNPLLNTTFLSIVFPYTSTLSPPEISFPFSSRMLTKMYPYAEVSKLRWSVLPSNVIGLVTITLSFPPDA